MKTTATNKKVREILTGIRNLTLIPRPDFQRRLVWSHKHKILFLQTILENYPFPEIYVAAGDINPDTGEGIELLVDGQQRVDTIRQYFEGIIGIRPKDGIIPYSELSKEEKIAFLEYDIVVRNLGSLPISKVKEVFNRINSTNYSLNAMEIDNSRYEGELKKFAESISRLSFFEAHNIFTSNEIRRMQDVRFVLGLIITLVSTYFNRDVEIEKYLEMYNDDFEKKDKLFLEIHQVIDLIYSLNLNNDSRAWKKADLFTLFVEMHRGVIKNGEELNLKLARHNLPNFYKHVDSHSAENQELIPIEAREYREAVINASNDKLNRIRRGAIIYETLFDTTIG